MIKTQLFLNYMNKDFLTPFGTSVDNDIKGK